MSTLYILDASVQTLDLSCRSEAGETSHDGEIGWPMLRANIVPCAEIEFGINLSAVSGVRSSRVEAAASTPQPDY